MSDILKPANSSMTFPNSLYPAISVIIPVYNAGEFIGECLDSLLNQTFQDFEVIVVDDCSTDNSVAVVESYAPKFNGRLKIFSTEKNSGGGYIPRNKGLLFSHGEYIYFVDSDDLILNSALEILYTSAKKYDAEVVYTGAYQRMMSKNDFYVFRDGEGKKLIEDGFEDKPDFRINDQKGNLSKLLLEEIDGNFRNPWTKFIRRDFLIQNEIYFPKIPIGEDFIWVINVYCHAKRFLRLPMPLYFYRISNTTSVTRKQKEPSEQIARWISILVGFMKNLSALEAENEILLENPAYCFEAFKSHLEWCLAITSSTRYELSGKEVYAALYRKFSKDPFNSSVPFFFSFIDAENKVYKEDLQTISNLEKEIAQLKSSLAYPAVSIIIPMYNAEKYIGECLDSLLAQTFQNFEVIVADACSTDNSREIVENYYENFEGRLTLKKIKKDLNGEPCNKGLLLSRGEYIQFLNADCMLTETALEEMHTLAKEYDADIVYCEKFYEVNSDGTNRNIKSYQKGEFVNKPTFESEDLPERIQNIADDKYLTVSWNKLIRRSLIIDNEIFFPATETDEDNIWTQGLILHAKKILRVPNVVNICRQSEDSAPITEKTPQEIIHFELNPVLLGLKALDKLMSKQEFFETNPDCRFTLLKNFIDKRFIRTLKSAQKLNEETIYSTLKDEFGERLGEYNILIPALCTTLYSENISALLADYRESLDSNAKTLNKFSKYFTARLDVQLITANKEDFQIISVSDDRAEIRQPEWFNKNGVGYLIQSYVGKLDIIFKVIDGGSINLSLRGLYSPDPKDKSKRIPYWVDYTKFTVNGEIIFDELTPAWHDKPYRYGIKAKADSEITISFEWLPHRGDT